MSAPPEVDVVQSFVNTVDLNEGTDALTGPLALSAWLVEAGLVARGTPASGRDLKLALRLRDALRAELAAHHDGPVGGEIRTALDSVYADLPLRAVCADEGVTCAGAGARGGLAAIAAAAATARIRGTWRRLKICPAEDCLRAFYDTSRNRSRRWCSMEVCGNRSKVRAFRDRSRT